MLTLLIALVVFAAVYALCAQIFLLGTTLSLTLGLVGALVIQIGMGFYFRKVVGAKMNQLQMQMSAAGEQLRRKYEALAQRGGNMKMMMAQAEKEQATLFQDAIEFTKSLDPYCKWSLMLDRQLATIRMQFSYQMKDFEAVDRLMPKVFIAEPIAASMKLCRLYHLGDEKKLEKSYKSFSKKFKTKGALIFAVMSWIRVKQNRIPEAVSILVDGKKRTADETLSKNWELLVNDKVKQFSNAPLGEMWYALQLEEPKQARTPAHASAMHPGQRHMMTGGNRRR